MKTSLFLFLTAGLMAATTAFRSYSRGMVITNRGSTIDRSELREYLREYSQIQNMQSTLDSLDEICPGHRRAFLRAYEETRDCAAEIDEHTETTCSMVRDHLRECSQPVVDALEDCLPEESRKIPSMIVESLESVMAYLCRTDGEHVFELGNACILTGGGSGSSGSSALARCQRRITTRYQRYQKEAPSADDVCEFFESFRPCFMTHIKSSCGNHITQETWEGLFDAAGAPCKESREIGNDLSDERVFAGDGNDNVDVQIELLE